MSTPPNIKLKADVGRLIDGEAWSAMEDGRAALRGSLWHLRQNWALEKAEQIITLVLSAVGTERTIDHWRQEVGKLHSQISSKDVQIEALERELEEARDVPWPDWANTILKTLQKYGYDPVVDGEVDLGEAFVEYLAGVGQEDEAQRKTIAAKNAEIERLRGETDKLADKIEDLIAEFGHDPNAALECVSEHLQLRRHGKPEVIYA